MSEQLREALEGVIGRAYHAARLSHIEKEVWVASLLECVTRHVEGQPASPVSLQEPATPLRERDACALLEQIGYEWKPDLGKWMPKPFLATPQSSPTGPREGEPLTDAHQGLDTPERVRFYEHDFYPLSNFSAFTLEWKERRFDTSEAAYHWEKFVGNPALMTAVQYAPSAHEAFKVAERNKGWRRKDWDAVKVDIMRGILRAKAEQHEYVRRKLLATGERELVEDSWRDEFWGWGPNCDGQNMLGKLWMEVRSELRRALASPETPSVRGEIL